MMHYRREYSRPSPPLCCVERATDRGLRTPECAPENLHGRSHGVSGAVTARAPVPVTLAGVARFHLRPLYTCSTCAN